jgi:hypothetical protein
MNRHPWLGLVMGVIFLAAAALPVQANGIPVTVEPGALVLAGAPAAAVSAKLRLSAAAEVENLRFSSSGLTCTSGEIAAVGFDPVYIDKMTANSSQQATISLALPEEVGTCSGSLVLAWGADPANRLEVPVTLTVKTEPVLALQFPDALTVSGWQRGQPYLRSFVLKETAGGSPLTGLTAEAGPFLNAEKRTPAAVSITPSLGTEIPGGGTLTGSLSMDLGSLPAGAYTGQILFKVDNQVKAALPVTLNVRDGGWIAALVLLAGVALGLWISFFRTTWRPRREVMVRIETVRAALESKEDPDLKKWFGGYISPLVAEAADALAKKKTDDAAARIASAEGILLKWRKHQGTPWMVELGTLRDDLLPRLRKEKTPYHEKLLHRGEELLAKAADCDSPAALHKAANAIQERLSAWENFDRLLDIVDQIRSQIPDSVPPELRESVRLSQEMLAARLNGMDPDDAAGWAELERDLRVLILEIKRLIPAADKRELWGAAPGIPLDVMSSLNLLPLVRPSTPAERETAAPEEKARRAQRQLTFWNVVIYLVGGLLLAAAGFSSVYLPDLTFGAHPLADYGKLLLWGFTGQAGFTVVADYVRGFGLPLWKA